MDRAFGQWLQSEPLGQYVLAQEQAFYQKVLNDIFGLYALQLGLSEINFLETSRITDMIYLGQESPANLFARTEAIPCDWRSVDLVVLPHTLELSRNPHQVLNEVRRVLVPEGKVVITGFNPASLWGIRQQNFAAITPRAQMVGWWRLKDWLKLLGFEISLGQFMVYIPPCSSPDWIRQFGFMEKAGNRWWPQLAAVYALVATKQVYNVTPLYVPLRKKTPLRAQALNEAKVSKN